MILNIFLNQVTIFIGHSYYNVFLNQLLYNNQILSAVSNIVAIRHMCRQAQTQA
jgi:hypothetical protein